MILIDLTGQRFGRWTVVKRAENSVRGHSQWLCKCDCGVEKVVLGLNIKRGKTSSCGCMQREGMVAKKTVHGQTYSRLYNIWCHIKYRCFNPKAKNYHNYGGRGITMCEEWRNDFQAFYDWSMQNGYSDDLSIDRNDNDGNYEPSNCRWATTKEQGNNRRTNRSVTYNGETHTITEWNDMFGFPRGLLYDRIVARNWDIEKAFVTPVRRCDNDARKTRAT